MKFLLVAVNAKYIHSNPAVYSLRAFAGEKLQKHIELAEYTINNELQSVLADIYNRKPDAIGFSCYIWNWNMIQRLLKEVPKLLPDADIWLGGPEVSYNAPEILKTYPRLTGIMIGEGEVTFREVMQEYVAAEEVAGNLDGNTAETTDGNADGTPDIPCWDKIAGLCLPTGYTPYRELTDLNQLPFLYSDLEPFTNKIIYYETSRGCPYRCSYCLSSIDKKVRLRDISVVKKELQFFLDNKVAQVKFVDRTFNCNHDHAMEIWRYIYEHDNGVTNFHFEISADILRSDEIELLNRFRPGLAQLEIGVQSTNQQTIRAINRVMDVEKLAGIVDAIHKGQNIHQHLDLIAGLPYEDYASFGRSFDRVYEMKPQQLQLGFLKVLKGSSMEERAGEFGIVYMEQPPYEVLYTRWLPYSDVLRLKKVEEMVELYYNSNQYTHTLPFLLRCFEGPFAMYEALADFYEEKGYFVNSPARAYRYQVLLEFATACDPEAAPVYKELLTYDMYLRENLKSRPGFALDLTQNTFWKDKIRDFYHWEEEHRHYLPEYADYDWKQMSKMTHLEPFRYPVWNPEELCDEWKEIQETQGNGIGDSLSLQFILFDYRRRNPLTYEAATQVISFISVCETFRKRLS